jgi:hypothetical protein
MNDEERLNQAVSRTQILRAPRQALATFGVTNIEYYLLTQPVYAENENQETVVRRGQVIASRPRIVTPFYLSQAEGFSPEARRYLQKMALEHGPHTPGVYYAYRNEPKSTDIVTEALTQVVGHINQELDGKNDRLATIIQGEDQFWDVSLMKFIVEMTSFSMASNVMEMQSRGLLNMDSGVPQEARLHIEEMFTQLYRGELHPGELQTELQRWGLFEEYQDRFFSAFRR